MPLASIEQAIKSALLSGDKLTVDVLKGVKSALQYEAVAKQKKSEALTEDEIVVVLQREQKKRREAADLYATAGSQERADKETEEAKIIAGFLPAQLAEEELSEIISKTAVELLAGATPTNQDMGKLIGAVKAKTGANADGATIARLVKSYIEGQA
jgi:hypothetical protein